MRGVYVVLGNCVIAVFALLAMIEQVSAFPGLCSIRNQTTQVRHSELQSAVDAAADGDTLRVRGTCTGTTIVRDKLLKIVGKRSLFSGKPVLHGGFDEENPVVAVTGGQVELEGLIITGGSRDYSGAGLIVSSSSVTLTDIIVSNNHSEFGGGGIYNWRSDLTLIDSLVSGNTGATGGGILGICGTRTINLINSLVVGNSSVSANGGGIVSVNCTLRLQKSRISFNNALGDGGGVFQVRGLLTLSHSNISWNRAGSGGGGIDVNEEGDVLKDSLSGIFFNHPNNCSGAGCP